MKKRIFSLLLCSVILMSSTVGCGRDENTVTESSSTHSETMEYQTMEPPEDGWTVEELLSVTYLCGTQLSYPLTLESLGEDFSLNTDEMSYRETEKSVIAGVLYKDEFFATIWQTSTNTFSEITNDMPISAIEISFYGSEIDDPIVMNGITFSEDVESVISAFGEPNEVYADNSILTYYLNGDESKTLEFTFDSEDMVDVQFSLK